MNERIKELIKQATSTHINEDGAGFHNFSKIKFAELIVHDAIATVQKRYMGDHNREDMEVLRCVIDLKKHFGVEE